MSSEGIWIKQKRLGMFTGIGKNGLAFLIQESPITDPYSCTWQGLIKYNCGKKNNVAN